MIRIAAQTDIPAMLAIYAPYVTDTTYSFEYIPPTREEFTNRFRTITQSFPWLVWEENGKVLGYAYGSLPFERAAYAWCGEVSIYLAPEAQGKGVGRKLYTALEAIMQLQGYHVLYALVTSENEASLAFHEKLGYLPCATFDCCGCKFGRWLGVCWLEKRLKIGEIPTQKPVPWSDIVENDGKMPCILDILSLS